MITSDDTNGNCAIKLCTIYSLSCEETKSISFGLLYMRRHDIPPFITMGKIVGSQIVRVHMPFDEMGFVLVNRYFDTHILIDEVYHPIGTIQPK